MIPRKVQKNQILTADLVNQIIDSIRECQIQSGDGYSFSRNSGGTTLSIKGQKTSASVAKPTCPFDVSASVSGGQLIVSMALGTVNGVVPSNIFDQITTSTTPQKYVYIECSTNGKNVTTASWGVQNDLPVPAEATVDTAPPTFKILVAAITNSTVYKAIPCSNVVAKVSPSIQEDKETYVAGERNYNQYYHWIF
jgi:hypothetical protein